MKRNYLLAIFLIVPFTIFSQTSSLKKIDISYDALGKCLVKTLDNNMYLLGLVTKSQNDFPPRVFLMKMDNDGKELWHKILDIFSNNGDPKLIATKDTGIAFLVTPYISERTPVVCKVKKDDSIEWISVLSTQAEAPVGVDLLETSDHGFLILGRPEVDPSTSLVKLDQHGKLLWSKNFIVSSLDPIGIIECQDSCLIIGGLTGVQSIELIKLSKDGEIIWEKKDTLTGTSVILKGIFKTSDENFIVYGYTRISNLFTADQFVAKYDFEGRNIWSYAIESFANEICNNLYEGPTGNLLLTGLRTEGDDVENFHTDSLFYTMLNSDGEPILSQQLINVGEESHGNAAIQTLSGDALTTIILGEVRTLPKTSAPYSILLEKIYNSNEACSMQNLLVTSKINSHGMVQTKILSTNNNRRWSDTVISGIAGMIDIHENEICLKSSIPPQFYTEDISLPSSICNKTLTIHLNRLFDGKYTLRISNLLGNTIINENIAISESEQDIPIDVSHLPSGVYIVEMQNGINIYRAKFVKAEGALSEP